MTTNKDLKRLVRERAARTGESYTTARRHVLARAGRPAATYPTAGLVPGYPAFGGGLHHESTLLAHLLQQAGHLAPHTGEPYTETTLCGLAGGVGFLYAVFEYRDLPPLLTIVAQHHPQPWLPAALDRLGADYRTGHGTAERALRTVDRPMHCLVDRGALPWHSSTMSLSADPYPVVVAGRDGGDLLIDDQAAAPRRIGVEQFAAAWSAYRKGHRQRITVDGPAGAPDIAAAMRSAIATTAAHLSGPVLGHAFDVNMGLSGMARLATQLRDARGKAGWRRRFAAPGALPLAAIRLYECLEVQYTAPGATRPLYAAFLDEAAVVLNEPRLTEAAAQFRRSATLWSALADRALVLAGPAGEALEHRLFALLTGAPAPEPPVAVPPEPDALQRDAFLEEAAGLVDAARLAEEDAVTLMRG